MIEKAHKIIRDTIRKYNGGYKSPEQIDLVINRASLDLYLTLLGQYRETKMLPNLLETFKRRDVITLTSGDGTLPSDYAEAIAANTVVNSSEFPARITDTDEFWKKRDIATLLDGKTEEEVQRYIKSLDITTDEEDLPENFVKEIAINMGEYDVKLVPVNRWNSKTMLDLEPDPERPNEPLHRYIDTILLQDGDDLPEDFVKEISATSVINGTRYEGIVVSPDKFYSRVIEDLIPDFNQGKRLNYLYVENLDYNISGSSVFDLPDDFVEGITIFSRVGNQKHEGLILTDVEFLDRINSAILEPTLQNPIARIYDNKIEFYPADAGNYTLSYYKFPSEIRPVVTVRDNKIQVRPNVEVELTYYKYPTELRPIAKFEDQKVFVKPFTQNAVLNYYAFPIERDALIRISGGDISCDPSTVTDIALYYLVYPEVAEFGYDIDPNGRDIVFNPATSTDLDWKETALSEIISRALMYLGISLNEQSLIMEEKLKAGGN